MMLDAQKAKIGVATKTAAETLGQLLQNTPKDEQLNFLRKAIATFRYEEDNSGYLFIAEGNTLVAHPINAALNGKDMSDVKDNGNVYYVKEMEQKAKQGGGFVQYVFPKPGKGDQPKLSYAIYIPGTPYWVGTGIYIDNIEAEKNAYRWRHIECDTHQYDICPYWSRSRYPHCSIAIHSFSSCAASLVPSPRPRPQRNKSQAATTAFTWKRRAEMRLPSCPKRSIQWQSRCATTSRRSRPRPWRPNRRQQRRNNPRARLRRQSAKPNRPKAKACLTLPTDSTASSAWSDTHPTNFPNK